MPVVDASVYVALLRTDEPGHVRSRAWFTRAVADRDDLSAPTILLPEVASALSRGTGDADLSREAIHQTLDTGLVQLVPITDAVAEHAGNIAAANRIRGCDSVYVAVADMLDDYLVTLDKEQLERGGSVVPTREP